jgi:hypothetical protein
MTTENKLYVKRVDPAEYKRQEDHRLGPDDLSEGTFYSLMMRNQANEIDTFVAPVILQNKLLLFGQMTMRVYFTNQDLQPLNKSLYSALSNVNFWVPERALTLRSSSVRTDANTGYFAPYVDDFDADFRVLSEELSMTDTR